uniref:Uncharacterized protein n=1 Tax=Heliothis virescens TaxID=7102 RepID=A0A2A4JB65_HELVI
MAFVVKLLFVSALVYSTNGGYLNGQHQSPDSFLSSALNSPSASFAPSSSYGAPQEGSVSRPVTIQESVVDDHGPAHAEAILPGSSSLAGGHPGYPRGPSSGSLSSDLSAPAPTGNGYSDGSLLLDSNLPGPGNGNSGSLIADETLGAPRVIGTTVTVGRPDVSATRYELQSVVQNVIRRVPVEVTRHVQVAVPQPVPVPVRQEVRVPVPQPYPVQVEVVKEVPYTVYKTEHVHVDRPVPVEVVKEVPVEVVKKVHVPVDRPYEVIKKVHIPVEKHVEVPYTVWKPYPLHIIKHVTHYKKKSCCWPHEQPRCGRSQAAHILHNHEDTPPVFLISVKASLHDNVGQSFYETSQASSPSPTSEYAQSPQPDVLDGMKEIVLYLTPDQVNALQAAGAVVRPYPEDEVDFTPLEQQLTQTVKPQRGQHYQMQWNPNQNLQLNPELQNYYKLLNIQEINDNLSQTTEATIRTTEWTTTLRYRFTSTTTRPRFKEREYTTPTVPTRKASRTNYFNIDSSTERSPFHYHYENPNFRNTPSNIHTPDNSPSPPPPYNNPSFKINPGPQTNSNFHSTPSSTTTPRPSKTNYSNQNSNIEHTTHFEFYYENKKFRNTPSHITPSPSAKNTPNPYNTPTPRNTPSSEITPNPYYTPSPKSTPNPYIAPSTKIIPKFYSTPSPKYTPSPYSTPEPNSSPNFNSRPSPYNTPSRTPYSNPSPYNSPSSDSNPNPHSTPTPYKTSTRLQQSLYQPEKNPPNNYFQSNKEIQGNQYHQSPSSNPSSYSTPRSRIIPSPKTTPNPYSAPSPYKSPKRLPLSLYQPEKEKPNGYFQSSKEIQRNQYHQNPSSTPSPSPYNTPDSNNTPENTSPTPNNTPSSYSTPSPYKIPSRLPQTLYQPEEKQPNNHFQSVKVIQEDKYYQNPSSTPTPGAYNTPSSNNTPSSHNTPHPYKAPTRLPQSLYQPEEKQPNNHFQSVKVIQEDKYHQNPSSTPSPGPYNALGSNNSPIPIDTPSPSSYSTLSPYKTPTRLPQSLYQTKEKQPNNSFQSVQVIQENKYQQNPSSTPYHNTPNPYKTPTRLPPSLYQPEDKEPNNYFQSSNQYQQPVAAANQNAFSGTTGNAQQNDFTVSNTNPHEDGNVCTEETTESQQTTTPPTVQIGNRKLNKYSARNIFKSPVPRVRVQEAQESIKPQTLVEAPPSYIDQTSAPDLKSELEETTEHKEPLNTNESLSPQQEEQEVPTTPALPPLIRTPFEKEDYLSLLLAPLYKHEVISEIVSQHKDDLTRSESNVNSKLKYLTKSYLFNTKDHKADFEKLPVNFSEQIALAKHEAITRSPPVYVNENSEITETSPQYLAKTSEFPIQEPTPNPQDVVISSSSPIPIELIRQFPIEETVINIGGRNVFARTEKPFTIQTIAPFRFKHTTPESIPLSELDSPVYRPIWEH